MVLGIALESALSVISYGFIALMSSSDLCVVRFFDSVCCLESGLSPTSSITSFARLFRMFFCVEANFAYSFLFIAEPILAAAGFLEAVPEPFPTVIPIAFN